MNYFLFEELKKNEKDPFYCARYRVRIYSTALIFLQGHLYSLSFKRADYLNINVNVSVPLKPMTAFKGNGTVLIDLSHRNRFNPDDLNLLLSRIIQEDTISNI